MVLVGWFLGTLLILGVSWWYVSKGDDDVL
jgi:hypothetical protein